MNMSEMVIVSVGDPMTMDLKRGGESMTLVVTPEIVAEKDIFGNTAKMGQLGVVPSKETVQQHEDPLTAVVRATQQTWSIITTSLTTIGQMIIGQRSADDLSGPIGIAQVIHVVSHEGFLHLVNLVVVLSISLGMINLFPIPVLDGGHLLFYAIEAVSRRPVSERALAFGFRVGFALIVSFFVFVMWHDLSRLFHLSSGT